jgi:hypothetical protein
VGDHVVELNGVPVSPTISDREFVEQLMSLSRPVVLGFTRQGKDFVAAAREEEEANRAAGSGAPATPEGYMVGGISMDEVTARDSTSFFVFLFSIAPFFFVFEKQEAAGERRRLLSCRAWSAHVLWRFRRGASAGAPWVAFFIGVAAGKGIRVLSFVRLVATTFVVFSRVHLCSSG